MQSYQGVLRIAFNKRMLTALLIVDLCLILAHILLGVTLDRIPYRFNISFDHSFGEFFTYAKWLATAALLTLAWWRSRIPVLLPFALLFLVVLLDDSLQFHEQAGGWLSSSLGFAGIGSIRGQDFGELLAFAGIAIVMTPLLVVGGLKTRRTDRGIAFRLVALVAALAAFGIVIDFIHAMFTGIPYAAQMFDLLEDGGEMIVASLIVAHAATIADRAAGKLAPA